MVQPLKPGEWEKTEPQQEMIDELVSLANTAIASGRNQVDLPPNLRSPYLLTAVRKRFEDAGWEVNCGRFQLDVMHPEEWKFVFWPKPKYRRGFWSWLTGGS